MPLGVIGNIISFVVGKYISTNFILVISNEMTTRSLISANKNLILML